jgi:outer membrane lipoprotein-sorting protein
VRTNSGYACAFPRLSLYTGTRHDAETNSLEAISPAMKPVRLTIALLLLCLLGTTGCLFRTRLVRPQRALVPLKTATQEQLVAEINKMAASVQTLNATVNIDTTVGGVKKGKITEYQEIRGYILAEKPKLLRMIGLMPIVRNRAFDMVSNGNHFKLSIPPKNRFIEGTGTVTKPSKNSIENLRPQVIYEALLMPSIDEKTEIAVMEEGVQQVVDTKTHKMVPQPNYHLLVLQHGADGNWHLYRKIYFDRANLQPYRQTFYNEAGAVTTDAVYSAWQTFQGILFPTVIETERPQEEYNITIKILKLTLNAPLKPEQFQLGVPPGATVTVLK